jgi:hypothetical protein
MSNLPKKAAVVWLFMGVSCTDPVLDDLVAAQGNETEGIEKGPFHRAGQRCVVCHQDGGEASDSPFTLAGTIFAQPNRQVGVGGAEIRLTDADGTKYIAKTNCVGNFFIKPSEWEPKFPVLVSVYKAGVQRAMQAPIGREADCAGCHSLDLPPKDPFTKMPHIYLFGTDEPSAKDGDPACPVDPVRPGTQ